MVWFEKPEKFDTAILGALVQRACGGDLHDGVRGPPVWRSQDAQREVDQQLNELGAVYGQRPVDVDDPSWQDIAELLSTPPEARFGRVSYPLNGTHYDVYAARNSMFGLIAVTDAGFSHLRTFRQDEQPSEVIVAALARWIRKGSGQQIHITRSELDSTDSTHGMRETPAHLATVRELLRLPVHLTCEFYAESRRPGSGRKRTRRPLLVYSLGADQRTANTWTMRVIPSGDDANVELAPADVHDVTTRIEDLRRELG